MRVLAYTHTQAASPRFIDAVTGSPMLRTPVLAARRGQSAKLGQLQAAQAPVEGEEKNRELTLNNI